MQRTNLLLSDDIADADAPFHGPVFPRDPIADRLRSWTNATGENTRVAGDVHFAWDARPRKLANGAVQGRVYMQRRGHVPYDIGGFKLDAQGNVVSLPAEFAAVLS